jgi:hypothetical protein
VEESHREAIKCKDTVQNGRATGKTSQPLTEQEEEQQQLLLLQEEEEEEEPTSPGGGTLPPGFAFEGIWFLSPWQLSYDHDVRENDELDWCTEGRKMESTPQRLLSGVLHEGAYGLVRLVPTNL